MKQSFLGSQQFLRWSKNSPHFVGPDGFTTAFITAHHCSWATWTQSTFSRSIFFKVDFPIIVSLMPTYSTCSLVSPPKSCIHFASPPHAPHASHPRSDHVYNTVYSKVGKIMKVLITKFSVIYSLLGPQVLFRILPSDIPSCTFFPLWKRPSFTSIQNNNQNCGFVCFNLPSITISRCKNKIWWTERYHAFPKFNLPSISLWM
jgi:hypothetical protein